MKEVIASQTHSCQSRAQIISVNNICQSFRFKSLGFLFSLSSFSGSTNLEPCTEMTTDGQLFQIETLLRIFEHLIMTNYGRIFKFYSLKTRSLSNLHHVR